ncbi:MAG: hypothetical protein L7U87_02015 [Chlamydiales bacterium]|nr:hypothetical protein [Chlamydiales bacterium]
MTESYGPITSAVRQATYAEGRDVGTYQTPAHGKYKDNDVSVLVTTRIQEVAGKNLGVSGITRLKASTKVEVKKPGKRAKTERKMVTRDTIGEIKAAILATKMNPSRGAILSSANSFHSLDDVLNKLDSLQSGIFYSSHGAPEGVIGKYSPEINTLAFAAGDYDQVSILAKLDSKDADLTISNIVLGKMFVSRFNSTDGIFDTGADQIRLYNDGVYTASLTKAEDGSFNFTGAVSDEQKASLFTQADAAGLTLAGIERAVVEEEDDLSFVVDIDDDTLISTDEELESLLGDIEEGLPEATGGKVDTPTTSYAWYDPRGYSARQVAGAAVTALAAGALIYAARSSGNPGAAREVLSGAYSVTPASINTGVAVSYLRGGH